MREAISVFIGYQPPLISFDNTPSFKQTHIGFTELTLQLKLHQRGQALIHRLEECFP